MNNKKDAKSDVKKNIRDIFTPSEINKYIYCPRQWYFEKLYGKKKLRDLYAERNRRLGLTDAVKSSFNRGTKFHDSIYQKPDSQNAAVVSVIILIIIFILFLALIRSF